MGSFCCGCCNCCVCECCEPRDDWNITDQIRAGERGAGWLHKKPKGPGMWAKRFFVLTDTKLTYYADADRINAKGEIIIVNATAKPDPARQSKKNQYHFLVSHPQCGIRELYAKNSTRRNQWIEKISEVVAEIEKSGTAMYGNLYKQGGLGKTQWQERWSVVVGNGLSYYDGPTESKAKGFIDLRSAQVREFNQGDRYCFEIVGGGGKKGMKKYIFSAENETERRRWVEAIKKASTYKSNQRVIGGGEANGGSSNPLHGSDGEEDAGSPPVVNTMIRAPQKSGPTPPEVKGYLMKKSPALFSGWQKRYFVVKAPGELTYYTNEDEFKANIPPKGTINIAEILPSQKGLELIGEKLITIRIDIRTFELQANSKKEAQDWVEGIDRWIQYCTE